MNFGSLLKQNRIDLGLTQEQVASKINVTRQTLSRWENGNSYPNLDTVVELSDLLDIPLDSLLRGEQNDMVNKISKDVRAKDKYKNIIYGIGIFLLIIFIGLATLGFGRANQVASIDRINPFLSVENGYALLPTHKDSNNEIDSFVYDDPFGGGEWLDFTTGDYNDKKDVAIVQHKGSYVEQVKIISKDDVPADMNGQLTGGYEKYSEKEYGSRVNKNPTWWPFN